MQTPEKLSLIGGSILLASTLVFTLKSQASNILPKVDNGMTSLFQSDKGHQTDPQKQQAAQEKQAFDRDYQQAQQKHWQTGYWGTARFYVDDQNNMHVGSGQLRGSFSSVVNAQQVKTISLEENVQAPQDSSSLFADTNSVTDNTLTNINGLNNLDTSHVVNMGEMFVTDNSLSNLDVSHFDTRNVTDMSEMFEDDSSLSSLDLSHLDTHNVTDMSEMLEEDSSLSNLDVSHFDTHNVTDMSYMFGWDSSLSNLDLSHFDTHNATEMYYIFNGDESLSNLHLGQDTKLDGSTGLTHTYRQGNQTLSLDGNAHPGTWTKQ